MLMIDNGQRHFVVYYIASGFGLKKDADIFKKSVVRLGHTCDVKVLPKRAERFFFVIRFLLILAKKSKLLSLYRWLTTWRQQPNRVHIHLEAVAYEKLYLSGSHVLVPNQEWFDLNTLDLLQYFDAIWCKTKLAQHIFNEFSCKTIFIGFCSGENLTEYSEKKNKAYFFSRTGISQYRGGDSLISLWSKHPEWPPLKIVMDPLRRPMYQPINVEYVDIFDRHIDYQRFAASSLFHIYMTQTEGFGHSIVEAMGHGAVVIVTDAPPMNEIANEACAVMVPSEYVGQQRLSPRFAASDVAIENAIHRVLAMSDEDIALLTENAKQTFVILQKEFVKHLSLAIEALPQ